MMVYRSSSIFFFFSLVLTFSPLLVPCHVSLCGFSMCMGCEEA